MAHADEGSFELMLNEFNRPSWKEKLMKEKLEMVEHIDVRCW